MNEADKTERRARVEHLAGKLHEAREKYIAERGKPEPTDEPGRKERLLNLSRLGCDAADAKRDLDGEIGASAPAQAPTSAPSARKESGWKRYAKILLWVIAAAALAGLVIFSVQRARAAVDPDGPTAPPVLTEQGCHIAADMTLVARALSSEGVERVRAGRVMALVYVSVSDDGGPMDSLRLQVIDLGYRRTEKPSDLATMVLRSCLVSRGQLGPGLLGGG